MSEQKGKGGLIGELVEYHLQTMTVNELMELARERLVAVYFSNSLEVVQRYHSELVGGNKDE